MIAKLATCSKFRVGQWVPVVVKLPQEESCHQRELSRPWHGPYRIVSHDDLDLTVQQVRQQFYPDTPLQIHQTSIEVSCQIATH